jgi:CRISPR-associated protein Csb2
MILQLTFLAGRYHATPWGRHVNEAVPEWPPSPFRVIRAALDAWYRKHPDIPIETVERLLSAISIPPMFLLPPARASHTRSYLSQNKEDPNDKKLVFDGFAVVDRGATALMGWPNVELDAEARLTAQRLFGSLNYLGRSESWIRADVLEDREISWNCVPLRDDTRVPGAEVVNVAGVLMPSAFDDRAFQVPSKGRLGKATSLPWLQALTWGPAEAIAHTMNRPPAMEPIPYLRRSDALSARPPASPRTSKQVVEVVRFSVEGRVPAPLTDAILIGQQVRRNLMGSYARIVGFDRIGERFSGKDGSGRPVSGHGHVSYLALDEDGDGLIDAFVIVSPHALTHEEQRAITRIHPLWRSNGHSLHLTPTRWGSRSNLLPCVRTVESHTPFAPSSHWRLRRDGEFASWLAGQVSLEAERRGLPRPAAVRQIEPPANIRRKYRWLNFRRSRKDESPQPAFGVQVTFEQDVQAPFSLGYASHFGLGCFIPRQGR